MLDGLPFAIIVSVLTTLVVIGLAASIAGSLGLIDAPEGRKQHEHGTPMVGGIGIVAGLLTLAVTLPAFFMAHWVIFACVVVLMVLGILDDIAKIHSAVRMLVQIGVGIALHFEANLPFLSVGDIWFIGDLGLGPYALTFTCIAVVGGINAINMMDGLDGLCGLLVAVAVSFVAALAYQAGDQALLTLALVVLAVVGAFLLVNYRFPWNGRARAFLGDHGAYVLGFLITVLFLMASQGSYKGGAQVLTPVTALWLLFIPLIDIAHVIWVRSRSGRWPVSDDRLHIHYLLRDQGWSVSSVVNRLGLSAFLLGSFGVGLYLTGVSESWSYVMFMACCVGYFVLTNRMVNRGE